MSSAAAIKWRSPIPPAATGWQRPGGSGRAGIPNATINETDTGGADPDPTGIPGRITVRNTGLQPWTADNYDLSVEYYTTQGGLFSAGVFRKDISDFFGDAVRIATVRRRGIVLKFATGLAP